MARYNVDLQDNEGNAYQIMANPDSVAEFSPAVNAKIFVREKRTGLFSVKS